MKIDRSPEGPASERTGVSPDSRSGLLAALYQAERQDVAAFDSIVLALIGGFLAYLGVAALVLNDAHVPGSSWVPLVLSIPSWAAISYYLNLSAQNLVRARSVLVVEDLVIKEIGVDDEEREEIGSYAIQRVSRFERQGLILRIQAIISNFSIGLVAAAFAGYCLIVTEKRAGLVSPEFIISAVLYVFLFVATLVALGHLLELARSLSRSG